MDNFYSEAEVMMKALIKIACDFDCDTRDRMIDEAVDAISSVLKMNKEDDLDDLLQKYREAFKRGPREVQGLPPRPDLWQD